MIEFEMFTILFMFIFLRGSDAVIYRLNDAEYAQMPPVIHLDPYEACQLDTDALYCTTEFALVSDEPNPLLNMIQEYSEHHVSHYNHTKLRHGICVTQTCKQFYEKDNVDLKYTLEACVSEMLSEKYQLKVEIADEYYCKYPGRTVMDINTLDIVVGAVCLLLLLINIVGIVSDVCCSKDYGNAKQSKAMRLLLCFSIKRNWKKLISTASEDNPRLQSLMNLHGVRALTIASAIMAHSMLAVVVALQNPAFLERVYVTRPFYILLNGMLVMQTLLMVSAFLLVYKNLLQSEKRQVSWRMLPKQIFLRWFRLSPSYVVVLALTATWFRHLVSGPLWHKYVVAEMNDCRLYWWQHILYINNYMKYSACMVQTWYLAVDMQLYVVAVIIYLSCRTVRSTKITLSLLLVIGMIIPAAHVYFQDLDGIQVISPELILNLFVTDPHFNSVYKRAHTNITGYIIGMAMAYLVYYWQNQGLDIKKHKTLYRIMYRLLYWCLFPLAVLCCYSGGIYYADAPRPSVYINVMYAAVLKPAFALFIGGTIVGCIFKVEALYRSILEWRGWMIASRLTYSAYLIHVMIIRSYVASITHSTRHNYISMLALCLDILLRSIVAACFLWLLVEAPFNNIRAACFAAEDKDKDKHTKLTKKTKKS